jgi:hypothetical protein
MSKKSKQENESMIEEINLDEVDFEEDIEIKEPTEDDLWDEEISIEDDFS